MNRGTYTVFYGHLDYAPPEDPKIREGFGTKREAEAYIAGLRDAIELVDAPDYCYSYIFPTDELNEDDLFGEGEIAVALYVKDNYSDLWRASVDLSGLEYF